MSFGGFGIGPGDIVLFTGFAAKVIQALKDEGGSTSEFRLAERQCRGFISVINELKSLDLSGVPESLRAGFDEASAQTVRDIDDYRETIKRYEKSMGQNTRRGWFSSAPRKVQWAFSAAEDLAAFRESLSVQLDLVKLGISGSILSIVSQSGSRASSNGAPSAPALTGARKPAMLGWDGGPMSGHLLSNHLFSQRLDYMTNLVYERLLTRPGLSLADRGIIYTLPDNFTNAFDRPWQPPAIQTPATMVVPALARAESSNAQRGETGNNNIGTEEVATNTVVDALNEYLGEMGLDPLSEQEMNLANHLEDRSLGANGFGPMLIDAPDADGAGRSSTIPPSLDAADDTRNTRSSARDKSSSEFGFEDQVQDAIDMVRNILQIVARSVNLSYRLRQFSRLWSRSSVAMEELPTRLMQYAMFLSTAMKLFQWPLPDPGLQDMALQLMRDNNYVLLAIQSIFEASTVRMIRWRHHKKEALAALQGLDSLRSSLSYLLQLHGIQQAEKTAHGVQSLHVAMAASRQRL